MRWNGIAAECVEYHDVVWKLVAFFYFALECEASIAEFDVTMGAACFAVGNVGEPLAAGGNVDDGWVDFVKDDSVELLGVGREGSGAEADVADADSPGGSIVMEIIEDDAHTTVRGVISGGHDAEFGRGELLAVDGGAVQQDKFFVRGVFKDGLFDREGAEEVSTFVDDAVALGEQV